MQGTRPWGFAPHRSPGAAVLKTKKQATISSKQEQVQYCKQGSAHNPGRRTARANRLAARRRPSHQPPPLATNRSQPTKERAEQGSEE